MAFSGLKIHISVAAAVGGLGFLIAVAALLAHIAEGIFHCKLYSAASAPALGGLRISLAVSDVLELAGVKQVSC